MGRAWMGLALSSAVTVALLAGCSSSDGVEDKAQRDPATPASAPASTATPAGTVSPDSAITQLLAVPGTGTLALVGGDRSQLRLRGADGAVRTVALPAPANSLASGASHEVLVAVPGKVLRVNADTAAIREIGVDGDVRSVALRADGSLAAGLGNGKVVLLDADGTVRHTISGLVSADVIDARDDAIVVLDRRQTTVTALNLADNRLGLTLRAGAGATNMIGDHFGRRIVIDTAGGELQVYTADPLVLHQRFPVGSSPYALAYDDRSETVWVTLTGTNEVVGYDLSTGIPVEVGRFPTVRQPDTVTIDNATGDLFVGSATGDGLQRIGADQRKRGQ